MPVAVIIGKSSARKQKSEGVIGEGKEVGAGLGQSLTQLTKPRKVRKPLAIKAVKVSEVVEKGASAPFSNPRLNEQLVEFSKLISHDTVFGKLASLRQSPLPTSFDFIDSDSFAAKKTEEFVLGEKLLDHEDLNVITTSSRAVALPSHLARLCEAQLLKPEQEVKLFRRMNYLLYVANKVLAKIDRASPSTDELDCVEALVKASNWHRDLIVRSNMRLVISIVKKYSNPNNPFDELLSDGIMATIKAVEKFNFERGFRFSTYATQVVQRNAYRNVMTKQKDRIKMGTSLQDIDVDLDDRNSAGSMSPDRWNALRTKLSSLLNHLDRREKFIVRARFSLGGHRSVQTLQRIADCLGVSKERIRQLEKRALDKLRDLASFNEIPEFDTE
jgi:RNA polymerase primary sigma factor